ncbi:MAG: aldose 1-epimerase [Pirellulaceae bacterium]
MSIECIQLTDPKTGSSAKILVGFGFNCFEFRVQRDGKPVDVLWAAPGFEGGGERASGSGIPILFPFPGRISGTEYLWEGQRYSLEEGDGQGNAIHGFVLNRPWRVLEQSEHEVTGQFKASVDDPQLLQCWPADFCITVTYQLDGNALITRIRAENPDDKPLPCGLGTHPYFRLPLGGSRAEDCLIRLPVTHQWDLADMLPTGNRVELLEATAYQDGVRFESVTLDNVFSGLQFDGNWCVAEIKDPGADARLTLRFDNTFRECVVYTPPHREAICIEPYTCVAGAFDLITQGIEAGVRLLKPGEFFDAVIEMCVE